MNDPTRPQHRSGMPRPEGPQVRFVARGVRQMLGLVVCALVGLGCDAADSVAQIQPPPRLPASQVPKAASAPPPCPEGMVDGGRFCIDRFEAHLVQEDGALHSPFERPKKGTAYIARCAPGVVPQGYISRREAESACTLAHKRLCRASEWQAACKGKTGAKYPYGDEQVKGRCNTHKPHLMVKLFGQLSHYTSLHYNHPRLNQQEGFLAKSGDYSGCVSSDGAFDMVGNLHEWVSDEVNGALPKKIPIPYGAHRMGRRGNAVFMGGYFSSQHEHGHGCEYVTTHHSADYHDYSTGFRCCRDLNDGTSEQRP